MEKFDLFISHSAKDKGFARRLRTDLEIYGYKVWLDENYLKIGNTLSRELEQAIRNSRFLLVVHSKNSLTSPWVERERAYAIEEQVPIIPAVLDRGSLTAEIAEQMYGDFTQLGNQHAYHRALHDILRLLDTPSHPPSELYIYSNGLSSGWLNSSWDAICTERYPIDDSHGRHCFRAQLRPFGGVAFIFRSGINTTPFSCLRFSLRGAEPGAHKMKVFLNDRIGNGIRNQVSLDPLPSGHWCSFRLPLEELDAKNSIIFKVNWSHAQGEISSPIDVADVRFTSENLSL